MIDFFGPVPIRFTDALRAEEIDALHWLLGGLLVTLCFEGKNTSPQGTVIRLRTLADLVNAPGVINASEETIRRRLHDLEAESWIACEVRPGSAVWRIRLDRLALSDAPTDLHRSSTQRGPSEWRSSSTEAESPDSVNADSEAVSALSEAPLSDETGGHRRDETRRDERTPAGEERNQSEVLGGPGDEAAFLAELEALKAEGVLIERGEP